MNDKNRFWLLGLLSIWLFCSATTLNAQQATIKEGTEIFRTYPFNDPSPVARVNRIYPYFRFDGYSKGFFRSCYVYFRKKLR